eukprot:scaffold3743_cov389-Prasinococcus_capsulatus_cf.AAC.18
MQPFRHYTLTCNSEYMSSAMADMGARRTRAPLGSRHLDVAWSILGRDSPVSRVLCLQALLSRGQLEVIMAIGMYI